MAFSIRNTLATGFRGSIMKPAVPSKPTASVSTGTTINVSWTAVPGAISYEVVCSTGGLATQTITSGTVATFTGVAGSTYAFTVAAINSGGKSAASTASTDLVLTPAVPGQPTSVNNTGTTINVSWTAVAGATSYEVVCSTGGLTTQTITSGAAATFTGVAGTTYAFTIAAINGGGKSSPSLASTDLVLTPAVPGQPTAVNNTGTTINVSWTAVTGATSYEVVCSTGGLTTQTITSGNSATFTGVPTTTYAFTIAAINSRGKSAASIESTPITIKGTYNYPPDNLSTTSYTTTLSGKTFGNGSYVTSASVERNGSYSCNYAFLGTDTAKFWQVNPYPTATSTTYNTSSTYTGEWVQIQLPAALIVNGYSQFNNAGNAATSWAILGSTDGSTWTGLDYKSSVTLGATTSYFPISTATAYSYYRYVLIASSGGYPVAQGLQFYSESAGTTPYRYFKFTPTAYMGAENCYQLSELIVGYNSARIDYTGATASNPGGSNPTGETPDKAIDNSTSTKMLDFNKLPLIIDFKANKTANMYTFSTANDVTGRDPKSWTFHGSTDNSNWTLLNTQTNYNTPATRYYQLPWFNFT